MKTSLGTSVAIAFLVTQFAYRTALPGYHYEFPRDHFSHPEFQTEWWYYTGNLRAADRHRFGFELTFFRHGVNRGTTTGVWDVQDAWLAHLALSDVDGNRFFHAERLNRSGAGLAGASMEQGRVWNGNWSARIGMAEQRLQAIDGRFQFQLTLRPGKPPVIHGVNGVSQKAAGAGHASHYISYTRLAAKGTITVEGKQFAVEGLSWMDHEFFTHQLEKDQTGWDWFSLQLDDGSELMLFRLRHKDGSVDPYSAGTYVDPQGHQRHLTAADFTLTPGKTPGKTWTSPETHAQYPIEWSIRVPLLSAELALRTHLPQQELSKYWEGAIEITGTKQGRAIRGAGYLEMTGYAGPVQMGE
jgi:predicted secreted hydrolase